MTRSSKARAFSLALRSRMLVGTALACVTMTASPALAQLVTAGDLAGIGAIDDGGNPGQLLVTNPTATTAVFDVLAPQVVAEWTRFNVPNGTSLTVNNASLAPRATLLNRVIGATPSDLRGTISSPNVDFWIINQNGILFGANTTISARSFVASTLNVSNLDFFNGLATTDFLNNANTAAAITGGGGTASITAVDNLWLISRNINVNGNFVATNESAAFAMGNAIRISHTPGSPLSIVATANSSAPTDRLIAGGVTGNFVQVYSSYSLGAGITELLTIDANLTATTAVPTATGILLTSSIGSSSSAPGQPFGMADLIINGDLQADSAIKVSGGFIRGSDVIANGAISGASIEITGTNIVIGDATASNGNIILNNTGSLVLPENAAFATGISAGALNATGTITLASIGNASIASAKGGGNVSLAASTAPFGTPATLAATGAVEGSSVTATSPGGVTLAGVTATTGGLSITSSGGSINTAALSSGTSTSLVGTSITAGAIGAGTSVAATAASGAIALGAITAGTTGAGTVTLNGPAALSTGGITAGGALTVGGTNAPSSATFTGDVTAASVTVTTPGALTAQGITGTGGAVTLGVGSLNAGNIAAATNLGVTSAGAATAGSLTATTGTLGVTATTLEAGAVTSGTSTTLATTGALTTGAINAGTSLAATSTNGPVALGAITTGTNATLNTAGVLSVAGGNVGGTLRIGNVTPPSSITLSDAVLANNIVFNSFGAINATDITSTGGSVLIFPLGDLTADNITSATNLTINSDGAVNVGDLSAPAGTIVVSAATLDADALTSGLSTFLTTTGSLTTGAINAGASVTATSTNGPITVGGAITAGTTTTLDTAGALSTGGITAGGALTVGGTTPPSSVTFTGDVTAASVALTTPGALTAQNITATAGPASLTVGSLDADDVAAASNLAITSDGAAITGDLTATSGTLDVTATTLEAGAVTSGTSTTLTTTGALTTGAINAGTSLAATSTNGPMSLGAITSGTAATLNTAGALSIAGGTVGGTLTVGNTAAPSAVTITSAMSADSVEVRTVGLLTGTTITATGGAVNLDVGSLSSGSITAATNLAITSPGAVTTGALTATTGSVAAGATVLTTGDVTSGTSTGFGVSAGLFTGAINAGSSLSATNSGGPMSIGAITTGTTATLNAAGSLTTGAITAGEALVVGNSAAFSEVNFSGAVVADSVAVTTHGLLSATTITSTGGDVTLAVGDLSANNVAAATNLAITATGSVGNGALSATSGSVDVNASALFATTVTSGTSTTLATTGALTTGAINAGTSLAATSTNGPMSLGAITSGTTTTLDTAGALSAGGITAGGALTVGGTNAPSSATFTGDVVASAITVNSTGLVSALGLDSGAQGEIALRSRDLQLGGIARADRVTLIVNGTATTVGLGSASGDYSLSDTEFSRINARNLTLEAGARDIVINGVSFAASAGSEAIKISGSGTIRITGDVTMTGNLTRSLNLGDDTTRLIAINTNDATVNVGGATLVLTARDILAGTPGFLTLAEGRESADLATAFVNDSNSALYDPTLSGGVSEKRMADPVYLTAGSLRLRFADAALFQNSNSQGGSSGVVLGIGPGSINTLTLETLDTSNAFAIFGTINGLVGSDAATAAPGIIVIDEATLQLSNARVNGCVIGTGEGCAKAEVRAPVILDLRSEARSLLNTGRAAPQPFDPMAQTLWQGLLEPQESEEATSN